MANQVTTTAEIILERIKARLIDNLSLDNEQVFIATRPSDDHTPRSHNESYVISGSSGRFRKSHLTGGGNQQLTSDMVVIITIISAQSKDQEGREDEFYTDDETGIYQRMGEVLGALSQHELQNEDEERIVSQPLSANDWSAEKGNREIGSIQIGFDCMFMWELPS